MGLALLGALAVLASTSIVVFAVSASSFDMSASPSSQTVTKGQSATYAVALQRGNKFNSPVALSVTGLPGNTSATFSPSTIPGSGNASSLVVQTTATTPAGSFPLTINGSGGGKSASTTVTLVVLSGAQPNFSLQPTPSARTLTTDDSGSYLISISRTGGFNGPVTFMTGQLPKGVSASFSPNPALGTESEVTLVLTTNNKAKGGTYPITVNGTGQPGSTVTRTTTVNLNVEEKKPFAINGAPPEDLAPGSEEPFDLVLSNPHNFTIYVQQLAVSLDPHSTTAACDTQTNFSVDQMPGGVFPLSLPAHSTRTLSELGVDEADMPTVNMHNLLATNQDGCKGAQVYFQYSGLATK